MDTNGARPVAFPANRVQHRKPKKDHKKKKPEEEAEDAAEMNGRAEDVQDGEPREKAAKKKEPPEEEKKSLIDIRA